MKFSDYKRLFLAKLKNKKTVLFSTHHSWWQHITPRLSDTECFFIDIKDTNLIWFDKYVPLSVQEEEFINDHKKLSKKLKTIIPKQAAIDICNDKLKFRAFLKENGFHENTVNTGNNLNFPYVFKVKTGEWGEGVFIIKDKVDEEKITNGKNQDLYLKEEFIPGKEEFACHIFLEGSKIKFARTIEYKYDSEYFIKGPNYKHSSRKEIDHSAYIPFFNQLLNKLDYTGICCLNYKVKDGVIKLLEINPRFGGSLTNFINDLLEVYPKTKDL